MGRRLGASADGFDDEADARFPEVEVNCPTLVPSVDNRGGGMLEVRRTNIVAGFKRERSVEVRDSLPHCIIST